MVVLAAIPGNSIWLASTCAPLVVLPQTPLFAKLASPGPALRKRIRASGQLPTTELPRSARAASTSRQDTVPIGRCCWSTTTSRMDVGVDHHPPKFGQLGVRPDRGGVGGHGDTPAAGTPPETCCQSLTRSAPQRADGRVARPSWPSALAEGSFPVPRADHGVLAGQQPSFTW